MGTVTLLLGCWDAGQEHTAPSQPLRMQQTNGRGLTAEASTVSRPEAGPRSPAHTCLPADGHTGQPHGRGRDPVLLVEGQSWGADEHTPSPRTTSHRRPAALALLLAAPNVPPIHPVCLPGVRCSAGWPMCFRQVEMPDFPEHGSRWGVRGTQEALTSSHCPETPP